MLSFDLRKPGRHEHSASASKARPVRSERVPTQSALSRSMALAGPSSANLQKIDGEKGDSARGTNALSTIVSHGTSAGGTRLDGSTQARMESSFGHDFSGVRVHTDQQAGESASVLGASAYTVGQDIVFASGSYKPQSASGQRLLAHELTHTIQQSDRSSGSMVQRDLTGLLGPPGWETLKSIFAPEKTPGAQMGAVTGCMRHRGMCIGTCLYENGKLGICRPKGATCECGKRMVENPPAMAEEAPSVAQIIALMAISGLLESTILAGLIPLPI